MLIWIVERAQGRSPHGWNSPWRAFSETVVESCRKESYIGSSDHEDPEMTQAGGCHG
jgi:hypothetical protein